ncbi:hypothetical protein CRM93_03855 [Acetobacter fabarum]|jgi:hypothetical protein|uniref:Uncharacterized protein n=1 Tax=Acetobacter fabarum TaxID=483199 RepID=A0A269XX00_9PROT|nr:hypothetical protein B8X00_09050 [Acetobacter fabarum]PEN28170.1 hypothetical protein CRM93_03855 [Acetobacter fabarum]
MTAPRQRFGKHARSVMADRRWPLLPLSARSAWLQLTDIGDVMPELRHPSSRGAVKQDELCRLLSAHPDEFASALKHLIERQIMEPVGNGFRLKAF